VSRSDKRLCSEVKSAARRLREQVAKSIETIHTLRAENAALRKERDHLRAQRDELHQHANALRAKSRGIRYLVHEFHDKFKQPVYFTPAVPPDEVVRFRLALMVEEFLEMVEAALALDDMQERRAFEMLKGLMDRIIKLHRIEVDMAEFIDGGLDLDYVVEGTRLMFGVDGWPLLLEVQRANLDKEPAEEQGLIKPLKPKDWKPPDIAGELRKQGWKG
jgi:predicted HAD superfamily Cof-like phosphohydrolase